MRIKLGKLRQMIENRVSDSWSTTGDLKTLDGFDVGKYYWAPMTNSWRGRENKPSVVQLVRIMQQARHGDMYFALTKSPDGQVLTQRFDVWTRDKREATPEEIEQAKALEASMPKRRPPGL